MPIYEYFCSVCHGRFRHLAKHIDASAPACPRCGNSDVSRLISSVNTIHSDTYHQVQLKSDTAGIDGENPAEIARFLKQSGRLEDASGLYGSKAYRELLDRRADGAQDKDLVDLVDDLSAEMNGASGSETAGAVLFSHQMENRMAAQGPPDDHQQKRDADIEGQEMNAPSPDHMDDLGWA